MMISSSQAYTEAFVWIWLPGESTPVVAGKLSLEGERVFFNYGKSYLERQNAISLYTGELPLKSGVLPLLNGLNIPGCIRDGAPDAWGRRVLVNRLFTANLDLRNLSEPNELFFLLESGSDRSGALDFQASPTEYNPRLAEQASLEELLESAERVEKGIPLTVELDQALLRGSSLGGARPKTLIQNKNKKYIAKFSSSTDLYSIVKAEFIAMRLAKLAELDVADVSLVSAAHKDVLLIERFDRIHTLNGWQRKSMLSALTLLALDEMMARYASYEKLAEIIRYQFLDASKTLKELFSRIIYNVLVGNTDDHARNHAAFWDGQKLTLTPAYDICPQSRTGNEASQAMLIHGNDRMSRIATCLKAARHFLLSEKEAIDIVKHQIFCIATHWQEVCDLAALTEVDRRLFWRRQFLNPYAFEGLSGESRVLAKMLEEV